MDIIISNTGGQPIYEQIYSQLKAQIIAGTLSPGEALPSIRALAKDLKISVITTKRAYDELEAEGFLYTVAGKGCFVAEKNLDLIREQQLKELENHLTAAAGLAKSCSVTVEEETTQLELDISQVDWSRYMALALIADSPNSTGYKINMNGGAERTIFMYRNSYGPNALTELCFSPITSHITMIAPVFYDGNHALSAVCFGSGEDDGGFGFLGGGGGSNPLNVCKYVKIQRCNGSFQPGDRAVLWGVK